MHTKSLGKGSPSFLVRYGIALLSVLTAAYLTLLVRRWGFHGVFPFFLVSIVAIAWLVGFGPALFACVLSAVAGSFFIETPHYVSALTNGSIERLVLFLLISLLIAWLSASNKKSDLARRNSEEHYRLLFERNLAGVFLSTVDGMILDCNDSFAKIFGYDSREEVLTRHASDFYFETSVRKSYLEQLQKEGSVTTYEVLLRGKHKRPVWVLANVTLLDADADADARALLQGTIIEITERKREEDDVREQKEVLQAVFDHAPVMMSFYNKDGQVKMVNREWERTRGWSMGEIQELNLDVLTETYPDSLCRQRVLDFMKEASGEWADFKTPVRHGHVIDTTWAVVALSDGTRVCMGKDITKAKRAEEELKKREAQLRDAQQLAHLGSWEWNVKSNVVTWSDEMYRIYGVERKDFGATYEDVLQFVHAEDRESFAALVEYSYRNQKTYTCQHRTLRPDGSVRVLYSQGAIGLNEAGDVTRLFGYCQDITERKRSEEALRESEDRYRKLFENAHDAIYVHDLDGTYTSVNLAAERLCGYSRDELIGKNIRDFIAPKFLNAARAHMIKKLDGSQQSAYEIEVIARDGHSVPVEVNSRLIYENGVAVGVQGMARDISDRKRVEKALRTFPRRLIGAQEAERRRIARELHDEIGQALTAIKINLQNLKTFTGPSSLAEQLVESNSIVDRALEQVRDLSHDLRPSVLDDLGLAAALRWYAEREARRAGLALDLNIDPSEHNLAPEIETACFRIAQEAFTNTVRHAQAKSVKVELGFREEDLKLVIRDDGIGFDVGGTNHKLTSGASLGLQGMQERVHAVGGHIEINSAYASGTEISVQLPFMAYPSSSDDK